MNKAQLLHFVKGTAYVGGGGGPVPTSYRFGALTTQGAGGVPVTGTTIVSGDPSGHWQISGGYLSPSPAGDTANLSGGPYALVLDDASAYAIAIDANAWDVRTQAEWDTTIAQATATLSGKTIYVRPNSYRGGAAITSGVDGTAARLRRADYAGLTIQGRNSALVQSGSPFTVNGQSIIVKEAATDRATFDKFVLRGARNVTLRNLAFTPATFQQLSFIGEASNHIAGITIDQCHFSGVVGDPNSAAYSTSTNFPSYGVDLIATSPAASGATGSLAITNCLIEWAGKYGINIKVDESSAATSTITGNVVRYFYEDGIDVTHALSVDCAVTISDNVIYGPCGVPTDSSLPHPDCARLISAATATSDWTVNLHRNIIFQGNARGAADGVLCSDFKTAGTDSGHFYVPSVIGNVIAIDGSWNLSVENAKNAVVLNNTVVGNGEVAGQTAKISIGSGSTDSTTSGTHRLDRNIAESYVLGGTPTLTNNVTLGDGGATNSYASVFAGPTFTPTTLAGVLAAYAMKPAGPADLGAVPNAGAIGSGAVLFATSAPGNGGSNLVS